MDDAGLQDAIDAALRIVASYGRELGANVAERARDSASAGVYDLIAERFRRLGHEGVFQRLQDHPEDLPAQDEARRLLRHACEGDIAFSATLGHALQQVNQPAIAPVTANPSGPRDLTVAPQASMIMKRSAIATGDIDQSRRIHVGLNGLIIVVIVAFLAGIGATKGYEKSPFSNPSTTGPGTSHTAPKAPRGAETNGPKPTSTGLESNDVPASAVPVEQVKRLDSAPVNRREVRDVPYGIRAVLLPPTPVDGSDSAAPGYHYVTVAIRFENPQGDRPVAVPSTLELTFLAFYPLRYDNPKANCSTEICFANVMPSQAYATIPSSSIETSIAPKGHVDLLYVLGSDIPDALPNSEIKITCEEHTRFDFNASSQLVLGT